RRCGFRDGRRGQRGNAGRIGTPGGTPFPREGLRDDAIRLRPPAERDVSWLVESVSDPDVPRWTRLPSPYTKENALAWIALAESMARQGTAYHLVVAGKDDEPLGAVGLEVHERPALHGEIGYWLAAPARRRGIATRAVRLLAGWALDVLPLG